MNNIRRNHTGHRVGESHPRAKASDAIVRSARKMHETGMGYINIRRAIGVNWRTVADWCRYDTRGSA